MNSTKLDKKVAKVISILKKIEVDGETMEHIIDEVGMSEQMLKQLKISLDDKPKPIWIGAEFPIGMDDTAKVLFGLNLEDGDEFNYSTRASIDGCKENNPNDCPWSYAGGLFRVVEGDDVVFDDEHNLILNREEYEAKELLKNKAIADEVKKKEIELKANIANAMNELNEHWRESCITFSLDEGYPFKGSFDEVCIDVDAWVGNLDE